MTILDAREADVFEKGFIPDSVNIGLNGQYAVWVGSLIDAKDPLVLVTEEGQEEEAILRLARVGKVYSFRDQFLPGSRFAFDQNCDVCFGHPLNQVKNLKHLLRCSDNVLDSKVFVNLPSQPSIFQTRYFHNR